MLNWLKANNQQRLWRAPVRGGMAATIELEPPSAEAVAPYGPSIAAHGNGLDRDRFLASFIAAIKELVQGGAFADAVPAAMWLTARYQ